MRAGISNASQFQNVFALPNFVYTAMVIPSGPLRLAVSHRAIRVRTGLENVRLGSSGGSPVRLRDLFRGAFRSVVDAPIGSAAIRFRVHVDLAPVSYTHLTLPTIYSV